MKTEQNDRQLLCCLLPHSADMIAPPISSNPAPKFLIARQNTHKHHERFFSAGIGHIDPQILDKWGSCEPSTTAGSIVRGTSANLV